MNHLWYESISIYRIEKLRTIIDLYFQLNILQVLQWSTTTKWAFMIPPKLVMQLENFNIPKFKGGTKAIHPQGSNKKYYCLPIHILGHPNCSASSCSPCTQYSCSWQSLNNAAIYNSHPIWETNEGRKQQLIRPKNWSKISGSRCWIIGKKLQQIVQCSGSEFPSK